MKIKNIKEMIRQSILAEYNMNEDYDVETGNSDVGLKKLYANNVNEDTTDKIEQAIRSKKIDPEDIKRKYNEMFGKNPSTKFADVAKALNRSEEEVTMALMGISLPKLEEAEEEEISDEETVDIKAPAPDVPADMPSDTTMVDEPTYTPEEAAVMSNLDNALKKSQGLNDKILSDLIGNIIIYFSRQHVVKEGEAGKKKHYKGAVKDDEDQISKLKKDMKFDKKQLKTESLEILKMRKLAGLLTEGEYAKALLRENTKYNELKPLEDILLKKEYTFYKDDLGFTGKATYEKGDDEISLFKDYEEDMGPDRGKTFAVRVLHLRNNKTLADKNYISVEDAKEYLEGIN